MEEGGDLVSYTHRSDQNKNNRIAQFLFSIRMYLVATTAAHTHQDSGMERVSS